MILILKSASKVANIKFYQDETLKNFRAFCIFQNSYSLYKGNDAINASCTKTPILKVTSKQDNLLYNKVQMKSRRFCIIYTQKSCKLYKQEKDCCTITVSFYNLSFCWCLSLFCLWGKRSLTGYWLLKN